MANPIVETLKKLFGKEPVPPTPPFTPPEEIIDPPEEPPAPPEKEPDPEEGLTMDEIQNRNLESAKNLAWEVQQMALRLDKNVHTDILEEATRILDEISKVLTESSRVTTILLEELDKQAVQAVRSYENLWKFTMRVPENSGYSSVDKLILAKLEELRNLLTLVRYYTDVGNDQEKTRKRMEASVAELACLALEGDIAMLKVQFKDLAERARELRNNLAALDFDNPDYNRLETEANTTETMRNAIRQQINTKKSLQTTFATRAQSVLAELSSSSIDKEVLQRLLDRVKDYISGVAIDAKEAQKQLAEQNEVIKLCQAKLDDVAPVSSSQAKRESKENNEALQEINQKMLEEALREAGISVEAEKETQETISGDVPTVSAG